MLKAIRVLHCRYIRDGAHVGPAFPERGLACVPPEPQITWWRPVISAGPGQQFQVQPPSNPPGFQSALQARFNILCNGRFSKECQPLTDRGELKIESRCHGINSKLSDNYMLQSEI
eukprot:s2253_g2.t1